MKISDTNFKKPRAAIITFQSANNYGAVLQAYALQEFLTENFCETKILDYHNEKIDKSYTRPSFSDIFKNPRNSIFRLVQSILYKGKNNRIAQFRKDYLNLTKRYDSSNIKESNEDIDVFISGSDQVWNYLIIGKDTTYFLDFTEKDKVTCSYAASIGVEHIPEEYANLYRSVISNIKKISVREKEGIQSLSEIGIFEAEIMPDPTLLLKKETWEKITIDPKIKRKYILVYKITKADKMIEFAKELSKKTGIPIVFIPNDLKSGVVGTTKFNVGPKEWLGYIRNAEYVVTNSFHGTIFSIIFGTKFFSEVSRKVNPSTSRLLTLLRIFGFEDRIIDCFTNEMIKKEISIDLVTSICEEQRNRARCFFDDVIIKDK